MNYQPSSRSPPAHSGDGDGTNATLVCRGEVEGAAHTISSVSGGIRIVSWNLAYGKPGRYKSYANRRRQWALLGALHPDIALLQECRPTDLHLFAPGWMAEEYCVAGDLPLKWRLRSSILVRRPHTFEMLDDDELGDDERRWLRYLSGGVAAASITIEGSVFNVASVHALAGAVEADDAVTPGDHERFRRSGLDRACYNDLAAAALEPWVASRRFIVGGDWNDARLFDVTYPSGAYGVAGASTEFFERRTDAGWLEAMRKFHPDEIRTYLDLKSAPYELDHVFTDAGTHDRLTACEVLNNLSTVGLSDHAPLITEIDR